MALKAKSGLAFYPWLLGLGPLFASFLTIVLNTGPLMSQATDYPLWLVVVGCLVGIVCATLLFNLIRHIQHALANKAKPLRSSLSLLIVALILTVLGVGLVTLALSIGLPADNLVAGVLFAGGLLLGAGFLLIAGVWCEGYAQLMPEAVLLNAAAALSFSGLLYPLGFLPFVRDNPLFYALLLQVISVLTLALGRDPLVPVLGHPRKGILLDGHDDTRVDAGAEAGIANLGDLQGPKGAGERVASHARPKDVIRVLWSPLLSAMIVVYIVGLVHNPTISGTNDEMLQMSQMWIVIGSPLVISAMVIFGTLARNKAFTPYSLFSVVTPVAITLLLLIPFVTTNNQFIDSAMGFIAQCSFSVIALACWTSLASSIKRTQAPPWLVFTVCSAILALSMLCGIITVHFLGQGGRIVSLVLLTIFLLMMVVSFALYKRPADKNNDQREPLFSHYLGKRCSLLSKQYHLSLREEEVFMYLARGYSHVFIAKELSISENTVRTHVKHIYSKLGLTSREGLLQLIDSEE